MRRFLLILLLALASIAQAAPQWLGTFAEDAEVVFYWNTFDDDGASVTRATDGTIKVRRDDGTDCTGTSVTDNEDTPDTGIHECKIATNDSANFAVGYTYIVWVDGTVIDGDTINANLATFSIEDRFADVTTVTNSDKTGYTLTNLSDANAAKLEDMLDGTGAVLTLSQLRVNSAAAGGAVDIDNSGGPAIAANGSTLGIDIDGAAGSGIQVSGTTHGVEVAASAGPGVEIDGTTLGVDMASSAGRGLSIVSGNGYGVYIQANGGNHEGIYAEGNGSGSGILGTCSGGGAGIEARGGATGGNGLKCWAQANDDSGAIFTKDGTGYDIDADIHGTLDTVTTATTATNLTNWDKTGYSIADATSDAVIADAVWNAATASYGIAGSYGLVFETNINATIASRSTHTAANVWAVVARTLTAATNITSTGGTTFTQTGDSYLIVSSGTHGNAALRTLILDVPTVAEFNARTLLAASYFDAAADTVARVTLCDTITTYTGNTLQTGDSFTRLGAPAGASVSADIAAVKVDTAAILADTGTTGVIVSEITAAALADMFNTDSGSTYAASVAGSVVKEIADNAAAGGGDATAANQTTMLAILQHATYGNSAIRTRGDIAWITGGGGATWTNAEKNQFRMALGLTGVTAATSGTGNLDTVLKIAEGGGP